ncbi:MAG: hypothetical protein ABI128_00300, partial [Rhodanobacter sp.]
GAKALLRGISKDQKHVLLAVVDHDEVKPQLIVTERWVLESVWGVLLLGRQGAARLGLETLRFGRTLIRRFAPPSPAGRRKTC